MSSSQQLIPDKEKGEGVEPLLKCMYCNKKAAERQVSSGENEGKKYFKCPDPKEPNCYKFFKWAEQLQENEKDEVQCKCEKPAKKQVVKKEGKNQGRIFYHCAGTKLTKKCNFWRWATKDEMELEKAKESEENGAKNEDDKSSSEDDNDNSNNDVNTAVNAKKGATKRESSETSGNVSAKIKKTE